MSGHKIILCVQALILSFIFGCPVFAQSGAAKTGTASIAGRVLLKGEPAHNVLVYLHPQQGPAPSNPEAVLRARTDEGGRFRIAGVAAGPYRIITLAPAFITSDLVQPHLQGKTINVSEGENVENVEVELKQGGVITGVVTDSRGRSLADERVTLSKLDKNGRPPLNVTYGSNFEMFQTDDRGVYRIYGLPEGRYLISVGIQQSAGIGSVAGSFYPRTFHPDAANETEAKVIEVTEGSENADIDITVPEAIRTRTISGRVVNTLTGHPVPGVEITWGVITDYGLSPGYNGLPGDRSNANGEFRLRGMTPGKYAVLPRASSENEFFGEPVICDLSKGDASGVEVKVQAGGSVGGFVVIEGTNDPKALAKLKQPSLYFSVSPTQSKGWRMYNPKINPDGTFLVRGLPPSSVKIQYNRSFDDRGLALARIEHNGAPVRDVIKVGAGEQLAGVLVVLTFNTFALRGELNITGGALPAGLRLYANVKRMDQAPQTSSSPGAELDARGQFVINGITPGEYEVWISPMWYEGANPVDQRVEKAFSSARQRVLINSVSQQLIFVVDLSRKEGDR
ncbi:MAG TPA: carboxypeptidase-like regulatory domain-containing protein [Blastocatellia bacterium]|nr:carboxypeptidase-like regulatory domain-containing protein [Blastocatellia bacterium]